MVVPWCVSADRRLKDGEAPWQREHRTGDARSRHLAGGASPLRLHHPLPEGAQPFGRRPGRLGQCRPAGGRLRRAPGGSAGWDGGARKGSGRTLVQFKGSLFDDLNAPNAMAVLFTFITRANAELDRKGGDAEGLAKARQVFATIDSVLDIVPPKTGVDADLAKWVEEG